MVLNSDSGKGDVYKIRAYHMKQIRVTPEEKKEDKERKFIKNINDILAGNEIAGKYKQEYFELESERDSKTGELK